MSLNRLKRMATLKHFSDMTPERVITDVGLYESVVIDLRPTELLEEDKPRIVVSHDVHCLQQFLQRKEALMLPCPDCQQEMAFTPMPWVNPRNMNNTIPVKEGKGIVDKVVCPVGSDSFGDDFKQPFNIFKVSEPSFSLYSELLVSLTVTDLEFIRQGDDIKNKLLCDCVRKCKAHLLIVANEFRRDYVCGLNPLHRIMVNFRIFNPIASDDMEEYKKQLLIGENESTQAYEYMQNCASITNLMG